MKGIYICGLFLAFIIAAGSVVLAFHELNNNIELSSKLAVNTEILREQTSSSAAKDLEITELKKRLREDSFALDEASTKISEAARHLRAVDSTPPNFQPRQSYRLSDSYIPNPQKPAPQTSPSPPPEADQTARAEQSRTSYLSSVGYGEFKLDSVEDYNGSRVWFSGEFVDFNRLFHSPDGTVFIIRDKAGNTFDRAVFSNGSTISALKNGDKIILAGSISIPHHGPIPDIMLATFNVRSFEILQRAKDTP